MLTGIPNTQTLADMLKKFIHTADVDPAMKRIILRSLTPFEAAPWIPLALEDILAEHGSGLSITADAVTFTGSPADGLDVIDNVLRQYVQSVAPSKIFTIEEAAEYLGISVHMIYTYTSRQGILKGMKLGRNIVFTQAELDTFNRHRRLRPGKQVAATRKPRPTTKESE